MPLALQAVVNLNMTVNLGILSSPFIYLFIPMINTTQDEKKFKYFLSGSIQKLIKKQLRYACDMKGVLGFLRERGKGGD